MKIATCVFLILFIGGSLGSFAQSKRTDDQITVTKIWDNSKHDAFPDLIKFKDYLYCTVRESTSHVGNENDGVVRVIRSKDGVKWESVALFDLEVEDVREARLSILPNGTMMAIVAAGIFKDGQYLTLAPYVSYSNKQGDAFSALEKTTFSSEIAPALDWIWRVTWHKGFGYGVMYSVKYDMVDGKRKRTMFAQVVRTKDGRHYEQVSKVNVDGSPNEATIRFDEKDTMYILLRRETEDQMGVLLISAQPYTNWRSEKLTIRLGGPNFLFLNDKNLVAGTRFHEGTLATTALHVMDRNGKILKTIKLPSGGDTSYPGLVMDKKTLWVAYYSSHEKKSSIYLAKVPLQMLVVK